MEGKSDPIMHVEHINNCFNHNLCPVNVNSAAECLSTVQSIVLELWNWTDKNGALLALLNWQMGEEAWSTQWLVFGFVIQVCQKTGRVEASVASVFLKSRRIDTFVKLETSPHEMKYGTNSTVDMLRGFNVFPLLILQDKIETSRLTMTSDFYLLDIRLYLLDTNFMI